ncbi:MAG TPA: hypothetical protein QF813_08885, partial [Alphaproteobacteria bacterium]|nr:hypothetical protein [Alphaproteobacteria bacterium]
MWKKCLKAFGALIAGVAVAAMPFFASGPQAQEVVTDEMLRSAAGDPNNWLMAPGNYTGNRYSTLGQINTGNVGELVPK